jgi:hypothetical protein
MRFVTEYWPFCEESEKAKKNFKIVFLNGNKESGEFSSKIVEYDWVPNWVKRNHHYLTYVP